MSSRPKNCVLVVSVPEGWGPSSPHAIPLTIEGGRFYAPAIPLVKAMAIADAFNRNAMRGGNRPTEWALVSVSTRRQFQSGKRFDNWGSSQAAHDEADALIEQLAAEGGEV